MSLDDWLLVFLVVVLVGIVVTAWKWKREYNAIEKLALQKKDPIQAVEIPTVFVDKGCLVTPQGLSPIREPHPVKPGEVICLLTGPKGQVESMVVMRKQQRVHQLSIRGHMYMAHKLRDDGIWVYRQELTLKDRAG